LVYSMGRGQPVSMVDEHLARSMVPRRIEFTVESFLLAPFLLEGTDLVTVVPEKAAPILRRTAAVRLLEPPVPLPSITEMLWWHPRNDAAPAHAWIRARIAEIAASLDAPASTPMGLFAVGQEDLALGLKVRPGEGDRGDRAGLQVDGAKVVRRE